MAEVALELFFDAATEAVFRAMWERLERHLNVKTPLQHHSRPHLSVVSGTVGELDGLRLLVHEYAQTRAAFPIRFAGLGYFPIAKIAFLAPTVTQTLLTVHQRLFERVNQDWMAVAPYEHPDVWHAHCTLATTERPLDPQFVGAPFPIDAVVSHIGLVEVLPHRVVLLDSVALRGVRR